MGTAKEWIESGKAVLGIEFGSTRIKAVLVDTDNAPIASGGHDWENRFEDNIWTYSMEDIWEGLKDCYGKLKEDVKSQYGVSLTDLITANPQIKNPNLIYPGNEVYLP